ncbi:MAG TPA: hypothetical protein VGV12_04220 [Gemmatimonadales bacterium]|nr:hypothetical protein [Gemmatimonadales bacterium]
MRLLLALLAAVQQPTPTPSAAAADTAHVVIAAFGSRPDSTMLRVLAINDFHGALEPQVWPWSAGRPVGGARWHREGDRR